VLYGVHHFVREADNGVRRREEAGFDVDQAPAPVGVLTCVFGVAKNPALLAVATTLARLVGVCCC